LYDEEFAADAQFDAVESYDIDIFIPTGDYMECSVQVVKDDYSPYGYNTLHCEFEFEGEMVEINGFAKAVTEDDINWYGESFEGQVFSA
jgi:hypothetical protein